MKVVKKTQCANCAQSGGDTKKDNKAIYEDGSTYCFACGDTLNSNKAHETSSKIKLLEKISLINAPDRGIRDETYDKYGVFHTKQNGRDLAVFPIFNKGKLVKQKSKDISDKTYQPQYGDTKCTSLFGQHIFSPSEAVPIIVTEGEEDALSSHQMLSYPAVSVTRGANGAAKEIQENLEWLSGFKYVVLCFDSDEVGIKAASECAELFEPGKVRIAHLPLKDANEMLLAHRDEEFKKCIWNAETIKPDTIVFPEDVRIEAMQRPEYGSSWPWESLTKVTYGHRFGEIYHIFAGTGVGKTEFTEELIQCQIAQGVHCGVFSIEQRPADRLRRMVSKLVNKRLYLPDTDWGDLQPIEEAIDYLKDRVAFYDTSSGTLSIEKIIINMRYLNKAHNTRFFVLDNLKALSTNPVIDGKHVADYVYMSYIVSRLFLLTRELNITCIVINHVRKSDISVSARVSSYDMQSGWDAADAVQKEGLTWESGRVPSVGDIYGGGNINDLVDYTIALSRNSVSSNPLTKRTLCAKILKSRLDSRYTGFKFNLIYDYETGRLVEEIC